MIARFFRNTLILFFILFLFVFITGKFDNKIIPDDINAVKAKYSYMYDSLDYLFMGNSFVYSGIDPIILDSSGYKCFNFGISTAGVSYYEILINDYLKNIKKPPKTILLLVSPMTFSSAADNWQAYPIHRYLISPLSNEYILFRFNTYREYLGTIRKSSVKGFKYLKSLITNNSASKRDSIFQNKGFFPSKEVYTPQIYKNSVNLYKSFLKDEFPKDKVNDLIVMAKKYQNMNIRVLFFEMPAFKLHYFFSKEYMVSYNASLQQIKRNNFTIIPCKNDMDSTCFRNIDHMNNKGAEIYTRFLIQFLKEHE